MPDFSHENLYGGLVAGVDEAGRGPLAGPVVAAAVIFETRDAPKGIDDSKQLNIITREELYMRITDCALHGVGIASVEEIDSLNILGATKLAMQRAVAGLSKIPDVVLVDGNQPPKLNQKTIPLVKGDSISLSIAAASIIAKVTRDKMMQALHDEFPHYGWDRNAGYGTALHMQGLAQFGVTPHHRRSFAPVRKILDGEAA